MKKQKKYLIILTLALLSSMYSITPIFAYLTHNTSFSAMFFWTQLFRPVFILLVVILLSIAWFKKLRPAEIPGTCVLNPEGLPKTPFFRTRLYLFIVTTISVIFISFPIWGALIIPKSDKVYKTLHYSKLSINTLFIDKLTCDSCEEVIISFTNDLDGVQDVHFTSDHKYLTIKFDNTKNNIDDIIFSISQTGFTAKEIK